MNSNKIYSILLEFGDSKPSQLYYKAFFFFQNLYLDTKTTFVLPCIVTKYSRFGVFQYKLLSSVLYLNEMLFRFGKIDPLL